MPKMPTIYSLRRLLGGKTIRQDLFTEWVNAHKALRLAMENYGELCFDLGDTPLTIEQKTVHKISSWGTGMDGATEGKSLAVIIERFDSQTAISTGFVLEEFATK